MRRRRVESRGFSPWENVKVPSLATRPQCCLGDPLLPAIRGSRESAPMPLTCIRSDVGDVSGPEPASGSLSRTKRIGEFESGRSASPYREWPLLAGPWWGLSRALPLPARELAVGPGRGSQQTDRDELRQDCGVPARAGARPA